MLVRAMVPSCAIFAGLIVAWLSGLYSLMADGNAGFDVSNSTLGILSLVPPPINFSIPDGYEPSFLFLPYTILLVIGMFYLLGGVLSANSSLDEQDVLFSNTLTRAKYCIQYNYDNSSR